MSFWIKGKQVRWAMLFGLACYIGYYLSSGIMEGTEARGMYICDTGDMTELTQCRGPEDEGACEGASCIRSSCGYRLFPHIDVTVAGTSDPYSSGAARSPTSFAAGAAVVYSLWLYVLMAAYVVHFLARGDVVPLTRLLVMAFISLVNEVFFKRLWRQRRPLGSCLYFRSMGMPSGHAASSVGLLTYLLLELFFQHPNLFCASEHRHTDSEYVFEWGYGWHKMAFLNDLLLAEDTNDDHHHDIHHTNNNNAPPNDVERGSTTSNNPLDTTNSSLSDPLLQKTTEDKALTSSLFPQEDSPNQSTTDSNTESNTDTNASHDTHTVTNKPSNKKKRRNNSSTFVQFLPYQERIPNFPILYSNNTNHHHQQQQQQWWTQHVYAIIYIITFAPIPFTRVYLYDHYSNQVWIGSLIGIVSSIVWYLCIMRGYAFRWFGGLRCPSKFHINHHDNDKNNHKDGNKKNDEDDEASKQCCCKCCIKCCCNEDIDGRVWIAMAMQSKFGKWLELTFG